MTADNAVELWYQPVGRSTQYQFACVKIGNMLSRLWLTIKFIVRESVIQRSRATFRPIRIVWHCVSPIYAGIKVLGHTSKVTQSAALDRPKTQHTHRTEPNYVIFSKNVPILYKICVGSIGFIPWFSGPLLCYNNPMVPSFSTVLSIRNNEWMCEALRFENTFSIIRVANAQA